MQDTNPAQNQTTNTPKTTLEQPQIGRIIEPPAISGHREHGPVSTKTSELTKPLESQPEIAPSTPHEVMIPQELKNTVEKGPDARVPKIEKEMDQAGVKLAKESTPVITTPTGKIKLPMTYTQALRNEKNSSFADSRHWLAALIMYLWQKYDADSIKRR